MCLAVHMSPKGKSGGSRIIRVFCNIPRKVNYRDLAVHLIFDRIIREFPPCVMIKAMDCGIVVSEFDLQSRSYVHFWTNTLGKGMKTLILPVMVFQKGGLGIE